jgi:hypothetical protein
LFCFYLKGEDRFLNYTRGDNWESQQAQRGVTQLAGEGARKRLALKGTRIAQHTKDKFRTQKTFVP